MADGLKYFGKKSEVYLSKAMQLLPADGVGEIYDCCFGSGNFTRHISNEICGIRRIGYEIDRSLFALHSILKDGRLDEIVGKMNSVEIDKNYFKACAELVRQYNKGSVEYDEVEVAFAELVLIYFSVNSGRCQWRNLDSFQKHKFESLEWNDARVQLQEMARKFYTRLPLDLADLNRAWQKVEIINDDFRGHFDELFADDGKFLFIDPPYLLDKRGRKREGKAIKAGYDFDWELKNHEELVQNIIRYHHAGRLRARVMLCSNFAIDDESKLIGVETDTYTRLIREADFRMVVVQQRFTSKIIRNTGEHKKRKVEVVYINYKDIVGNWDNFCFYDRL